MLRTLILSILLCISIQSYTQYLEPNESIYDLEDYEFEYYSTIRKRLIDSNSYELRLIVKPSFQPEYIFQIEKKNSEYLVSYKVVDENIWYAKNRDKVHVLTYYSLITKEDFQLIYELYNINIKKVHQPFEDILGLDGTTYYFSIYDFGQRSGKIWSPGGKTWTTIIALTEHLIEQTKSKVPTISFTPKQRVEAQKLIAHCNHLPELADYKVLYEINALIEKKKEEYLNKLTIEEMPILLESINKLQKSLIKLLLYGKFEKKLIQSLIKYSDYKFMAQLGFENFILEGEEQDHKINSPRILEIKNNNLFTYLLEQIDSL